MLFVFIIYCNVNNLCFVTLCFENLWKNEGLFLIRNQDSEDRNEKRK